MPFFKEFGSLLYRKVWCFLEIFLFSHAIISFISFAKFVNQHGTLMSGKTLGMGRLDGSMNITYSI